MSDGVRGPECRWEYGSEFHWMSCIHRPRTPTIPADAVTFASGRDALAALLPHGRRQRAWRRCFVPSYFCPDVVATIVATGLEVVRYEDSPRWAVPRQPAVPFQSGDAFLLVNLFGLRGHEAAEAVDLGPADLVEDHTHDPWSAWAQDSKAAYCLASLRKTLPIPDGAALWSPLGLSLPAAADLTSTRESASLKKLAAMVLKRLYLHGQFEDKATFRRLQIEGEADLASGSVSAASGLTEQLLRVLPWDHWRKRRAANAQWLGKALEASSRLDVLRPHSEADCPVAVVVEFPRRELREHVRQGLIASAIYPAVHWSIDSQGSETLRSAEALSQRLLSLPCDFRYGAEDLLRVCDAVQRLACEAA